MQSLDLTEKLKQLQEDRKTGKLGVKDFYFSLLDLLMDLKNALQNEDINEAQIKRQTPLLLTFLKAQIKALQSR